MTSTQSVVELIDVHASRGANEVLHGVSMSVGAGELVALRGDSGGGKTSVLMTCAGLLRPTSGRLIVRGEERQNASASAWARFRLKDLGVVHQDLALFPELTVEENVTLPFRLTGRSREDGLKRAGELMDHLGIAELGDRFPHQISGGQAQRVAVARAVMNDPPIILADEPTASLDADTAREAFELLTSLARANGSAVLAVTHDDAIAARCDRQLWLKDGTVVAQAARP